MIQIFRWIALGLKLLKRRIGCRYRKATIDYTDCMREESDLLCLVADIEHFRQEDAIKIFLEYSPSGFVFTSALPKFANYLRLVGCSVYCVDENYNEMQFGMTATRDPMSTFRRFVVKRTNKEI